LSVVSRARLASSRLWKHAFGASRKDRRYYEIVEDTLWQGFEYHYFLIRNELGEEISVQPFFVLEQDLLAGVSVWTRAPTHLIRRAWPRFATLRTLMVGCVAGEGHLDGDELTVGTTARHLGSELVAWAWRLEASMIVLKEFPAKYRSALACLLDHGFSRLPSLPMTKLNIEYADFDDYMVRALSRSARRKLRLKFRDAEAASLDMSVENDITASIEELYPLYLQVYERSKFHFEKLTKEYFCALGQRMPDKVRFFVWRQQLKARAFALCMIEGDALYTEYIGLDYSVAFDLHLYHYAVRDMTSWAIANGFKWLRSSGLNYDPKLHLRHSLDPIDLYVRHRSPIINAVLKLVLPLIEPTRYDPTLKKFPNYSELR
jgi:peptidoglycan biosynthesis/recognition FemAB-like protein